MSSCERLALCSWLSGSMLLARQRETGCDGAQGGRGANHCTRGMRRGEGET
jgi:hypothetical protein